MWTLVVGVVLVITFGILRWTNPNKDCEHSYFSTDGSVINTIVSGEERIRRMPGPGNQPYFRNLMNSVVDDISCTYQEWTGSGFHQSIDHSRNPQARTELASANDDPEDEVSTAHVPGNHAPGVRCDVCKPTKYRSDGRNPVLLASKLPPPGAPPFRAAPPPKPMTYSRRHHFGETQEVFEEGTGEANFTFSTFNVCPADSDDSSG